jgi:hypothetical protein
MRKAKPHTGLVNSETITPADAHPVAIPKRNPRKLELKLRKDETEPELIARTLIDPSVRAAITALSFVPLAFNDRLDITELVSVMSAQVEKVVIGDLDRPEAMLMAQAVTLDSMFNNLACRAAGSQDLARMEVLMRMALKAQNQSRMTLETLAAVKNPPVVFAKQANIAHGHQQVNNYANESSHAHVEK